MTESLYRSLVDTRASVERMALQTDSPKLWAKVERLDDVIIRAREELDQRK
jgi:hypothetical protein